MLRAALAVVFLAGCSSGEPANVRPSLSFPEGNDLGHCASNTSPECLQGTPLADKHLVLTFDDGPGARTKELSSWLAARGIRATFFVLGEYALANPSVMGSSRATGT